MKEYYHMYAKGSESRDFITTEPELVAAFNRIGLCSHLSKATVVSFSIEDSHPHALLWGTFEQCEEFRKTYEEMSLRCIARRRGSLDGVRLRCVLDVIEDESYLMNVAVYTIIQATKDGKSVMPFDYIYGSGALYFRSARTIMPWLINEEGMQETPKSFGDLSYKEKKNICWSKSDIPDSWLVCQGFILPTNYVDVKRFESIYKTHNCYRAFMASSRTMIQRVLDKMAMTSGILIEDLEARKLCADLCLELFNRKGTRHLTPGQRLNLARALQKRHGLCLRQLSTLTKIPEEELRSYLR